jgi:hypothetical protein
MSAANDATDGRTRLQVDAFALNGVAALIARIDWRGNNAERPVAQSCGGARVQLIAHYRGRRLRQ